MFWHGGKKHICLSYLGSDSQRLLGNSCKHSVLRICLQLCQKDTQKKSDFSLSPETLEALVCAKDWLFGLNDADEGKCRI